MSRLIRLVPWSLSIMLFTTAGYAEPRKPTHVACVGDSITAGSGVSDPAKNYPSQLQTLLGNAVQVKNFGVSGSTMLSTGDNPYVKTANYTAATDYVSNAGADAVVTVIIILGANDSKPANWEPVSGKKDQQYKQDYLAMVDHFAGLATKPAIYVGFPLSTGTSPCCAIRGDVIHDQELPLIKQVVSEKRLPFIDLNTPTAAHPEYFGDGVHPNEAGYLVMANLVKDGLARVPLVNVTSPTANAMLDSGAMVPLSADGGDSSVDFTSVEFFEGTTSLGKASAKPFTVNWSPAAGSHTITAKAIDTTLASATSMPVTFVEKSPSDPITGGAGGASGASGSAAVGGVAAGGVATAGAATAGTTAAAGTSGANAAAGTGGTSVTAPTEADSGCSCAVPGPSEHDESALIALVGGLVVAHGRRRRTAQRDSSST
jgi:lysophospholipase L1-like esterase